MPIDGIRCTVTNQLATRRILEHPDLNFLKLIDGKTGEDTNRYDKLMKNFLRYSLNNNDEMVIEGNLFQFFTGFNNVGDFRMADVVEALDRFCAYHDVAPKDIIVNKLEVGFNIPCWPRAAKDIMDDIVTYRYTRKEVKRPKPDGLINAFTHDDYKLLFYDKGKKDKLRQEVLREELVAARKLLTDNDIYTVEDLYDSEKILALCLHLRKSTSQMIFTDRQLDPSKLSKRELKFFHSYRTDLDWVEKIGYSPDYTRKLRHRYQKLIEQHGTNNTQKWLLDSLDEAIEKHGLVKIGKNDRFSTVDKRSKSGVLVI